MLVILLTLCLSDSGAVIYHLNEEARALQWDVCGLIQKKNILYNVDATDGRFFKLQILESEYERMPALFGLDDYEACLSEPLGLYCVVKLDLYAEPDNQLMHMIREYSAVVSKHYNHSYIERGMCVSRCAGAAVAARAGDADALGAALAACEAARLRGVRARLSRLYYCDAADATNVAEVDRLDWAVAAAAALFLAASLVGTLYDYSLKKNLRKVESGNKYILSFSIIRNWQWLVSYEIDNPRLKALKGFHGVRTITNVLMILAHVMTLIAVGFTEKPHDFEKTYENTFFIMCYNGMMIVQVFFCMSAFLLVYNLLVRFETIRTPWKAIPVIMALRWWRLIPAYALTMGFTTTWFRFMGSGPLWNLYVTGSVISECRQYWWYHMLFINNYVPENKFCAIQSWYLGADTQLFFVGLLVYATTKNTTRKIVLAALLILSVVLPALHVWIQDLDGVMIMTPEFYRTMMSDNFRRMHVFGHNNLSSYVVGMVSGNLVCHWQKKGVDISKSKIYNALLWLVFPGVAAMFYSGKGFYADGERASLLVRMLYASLHRLVVSLIVAVGFIGLAMKCENALFNIMQWRGWVVPSRLAYCVYLLHFNLIYILHGIKTQLSPVTLQYLFLSYLGIIIASFALALPFFLIVEAPVNRLMKTILEETSGRETLTNVKDKNKELLNKNE